MSAFFSGGGIAFCDLSWKFYFRGGEKGRRCLSWLSAVELVPLLRICPTLLPVPLNVPAYPPWRKLGSFFTIMTYMVIGSPPFIDGTSVRSLWLSRRSRRSWEAVRW